MWSRTVVDPAPSIEALRKNARILVVDDQEWPAQQMFERDGYHIERWAEVKNLSQLIDGHYHLILLDVHGVGLNESPDLQGLGILEHVKKANPAQAVIVYSAQKQKLSANQYLMRADAVLDKKNSYVTFKDEVDRLLLRRATPSYFIAAMNQQLGESAALVPKAVSKALGALAHGDTSRLERYLRLRISDVELAQVAVGTIGIGVETIKLLAGS
jgi:CheY-like chemotaxis protein